MVMEAHRHVPMLGAPDTCAECNGPWVSIRHQPSLVASRAARAVRGLSEMPPDLRALAPYERPSGAPFRPCPGAPATHTGRPAQHSGTDEPPTIGCPTCGDAYIGRHVLTHLRDQHLEQWPSSKLAAFAKGHGLDPIEEEPEFCDHPNGFGPMGCPCGANAPGEDAPDTVRNINTGEDVLAVPCPECGDLVAEAMMRDHMEGEHGVPPDNQKHLRCPVSIDCAFSTLPPNLMRKHLSADHGWRPTRVDDWMESVGVMDVPLIPAAIKEAMAAVPRQEVERFMNPDISTEDLLNAASVDKDELKAAMDAMAPVQMEALLTEWWMDRAEEEARSVVPKAVEYGSNSLMQLGRKMAQLQGREVKDDEALELGCWANLVQKVERITDSVMRGERCSDDTIYDVGIYIKMVQRIRDSGSWPGLPKD